MELLIIIAVIFGLVLGVLWVVLPFAVFGVKKRLDVLIKQNDMMLSRGK